MGRAYPADIFTSPGRIDYFVEELLGSLLQCLLPSILSIDHNKTGKLEYITRSSIRGQESTSPKIMRTLELRRVELFWYLFGRFVCDSYFLFFSAGQSYSVLSFCLSPFFYSISATVVLLYGHCHQTGEGVGVPHVANVPALSTYTPGKMHRVADTLDDWKELKRQV